MCGGNCGQRSKGNEYSCPHCGQVFITLCGGRILTPTQYEEMIAKEKAKAEKDARGKALFDSRVEEIWNSFDFRSVRSVWRVDSVMYLTPLFILFFLIPINHIMGVAYNSFFWATTEKDVFVLIFAIPSVSILLNRLLFLVRKRKYFEKHPGDEQYKEALLKKLDPPSPHGAVGM